MINLKYLIPTIVFSCFCFGQKKCNFVINEKKIFAKENLDYFLKKIESKSFHTFNNGSAIPKHIKKELDCITGNFSIADKNQKYHDSCFNEGNLAKRQILFFAKNKELIILTYATGGDGSTTHYLFLEYNSKEILNLWSGMTMGISSQKSLNEIIDFINRYRDTPEMSDNYLSL